MDAMPYRPGFGISKRANNENIPPVTNRGLHHRHKSTGNLLVTKSVLGLSSKNVMANELNGRAKPTTTYEGSALTTRNNGLSTQAILAGQENRSHASTKEAFLQPAQRPPKKSLVPSASMHHLRATASQQQSHVQLISSQSHLQPLSQQHHAEKRIAPLNVYSDQPKKDNLDVPQRPFNKAGRASTASSYDTQSLDDSENWVTVQHESHPEASLDQSQHSGTSISLRTEDDVTEAVYLDAVEELNEELADEKYPALVPERKKSYDSVLYYSKGAPTEWHSPSIDFSEEERDSSNDRAVQPVLSNLSPLPIYEEDQVDNQADLSDYEDADYYDDQGYSTAHSCRDNTTGGVTMVVMPPKLTRKGIAEIENAKRITVDNNKGDASQAEEDNDISMVTEYGDDIFQYMREMEMDMLPNPHYMDSQTDIQWSMRAVLMDWVIQVHTRFTLLPETLFLAVNYIDRFLSVKVVSIGKLQLVGATALLLAAKYEEINCPSVQEVVYMVDNGYTQEDILKAERFMLSMLDFQLGWPGPMSFLRRTSKADDYCSEIRTLAKYLLEITIMDERFVASPPSYLAAGSLCLARLMLGKGGWTHEHVHYSGYTFTQLKPLVVAMFECCEIGREHHRAIFEKYSSKAFKGVALFVEEQVAMGFKLPFQQGFHHHHMPADLFDDIYPATSTYATPVPLYG
ncbi:cyclin-like protein [Hypoxylon trugodes]|uniref:cyclin-like protein n=1 Tax=Hypoxylon trugodes TaxID=326681 RepID=UPI00219D42F7|nr:cyclin-like protein [Hypoxylon trugodes]KAI1390742.1 cyclin-like protein [Hypoxylon trugodes]